MLIKQYKIKQIWKQLEKNNASHIEEQKFKWMQISTKKP